MTLLATIRGSLSHAISDLDALAADSVIEREIALAAVRWYRGEPGAAEALAVLVRPYSHRIDVARAVGHAPDRSVP